MKALVFEEPRRASVLELDVPTIAADEVLVRSRNVGICHSDFELYEGRYIIPVSYPIIPGHEWSGEVAEVGSAVTTLRAGRPRRRRMCRQQRRRPLRLLDQRRRRRVLRRQGVVAAPYSGRALVQPGRVRRAVLGGVQRRGRGGRDRRERRRRGDRRRADRPPLHAGGGDHGRLGHADRAPAASSRARARDRGEAGDRPDGGRSVRAGGRGDGRTRVRRRDRGRRRAGGDGERVPDRRARRPRRASSASTSAAPRPSRSAWSSRRRSRCEGSSAPPGCGRARSASWRRAASTRRRCSRPPSRWAKEPPRSTPLATRAAT